MRRVVSARIQVDPGGEQYSPLYTVSPGSIFTLKKVTVYFPTGTLSELQVKLYNGWIPIAPTDGYFTGDDVKIEVEVDEKYGSQSTVMAYLRNTNTASPRECVVTLEGEES
jgi:hypothetical protein